MNYDKYLPIGTVLMLKGGKKKVMIVGFLGRAEMDDSKKIKVFDYIGCLYPEGIVSLKENLLFNHENIDKIYNLGFSDDEDKSFRDQLLLISEEINNI